MESKNNINKQNTNSFTDTENRLMVSKERGVGGVGKTGEGMEKYRLVVTNYSLRCKVEHRKYSQ